MIYRGESPTAPQAELDELANLPRSQTEEHTIAGVSFLAWRQNLPRKRQQIPSRSLNTSSDFVLRGPSAERVVSLTIDVGSGSQNQSASEGQDQQGEQQQQSEKSAEEKEVKRKKEVQMLHWNDKQKDYLLGAFFLGYVLFQIPIGIGAGSLGAKPMFLFLGIGTSITSLLFPYACLLTDDSITLAYIDRFAMGVFQAGLFPSAYVLLCQWLPKQERSKWLPVTGTASRIGMIFMNFIVPVIVKEFDWEMVFYFSGLITLVWTLAFAVIASNSPSSSCWISQREQLYIESRLEKQSSPGAQSLAKMSSPQSRATSLASLNQQLVIEEKLPPISWRRLLTNRAMIIMTCAMFAAEWSNLLLLIKLPGFLSSALKMEISEIGLWGMVLNVIYCFWFPFTGYLASRLEEAEISGLNSLRIRKLFEMTALSLQTSACLMLAFFPHKTVVIIALVMLMLGRSTVGGGQCLMPPELSRDYPGQLVAVTNSVANLAGIVGPVIVNYLVSDPRSYESWRIVWLVSAAIFVTVGFIFMLFAQNKPQNYSRKTKSQAPPPSNRPTVDEEIIKMDAYSRVMSNPSGSRPKR